MAEVAALATPSIRRQIGNKGRIAEQGALTWCDRPAPLAAAHDPSAPLNRRVCVLVRTFASASDLPLRSVGLAHPSLLPPIDQPAPSSPPPPDPLNSHPDRPTPPPLPVFPGCCTRSRPDGRTASSWSATSP
eukprot:scaffold25722_cov109-Isochrysis_galbana.AAC.3